MFITMLYQIDGNTLKLHLHPGQQRAYLSKARIIAVLAGTQGGKTSFTPWWLLKEIQRVGPGDYLAVSTTYDLFKLKLLPEFLEVYEGVLGIGRYWAGDQILELKDPSTGRYWATRAADKMWARIILRSAQSKSGLESATGKAAILDEAGMDEFTLAAWEAILRRLSINQGRILLTTTIYNLGWLKQVIYDAWERGAKDIDVISFDSTTNPAFPKAEFERARDTLPQWKFDMFYRGLFTRPAGMIYSDFVNLYKDEGGHKVKPFPIPAEWPVWCGVDPGANNTAKVWVAASDNKFYLMSESLEGEKSTSEHAQSALELAKEKGWNVVMHVVGQPAEKQIRYDWQDAGVFNVTEPPFADVESGIDKIIALLKQHRLFIFDTCTGLLDEIGRYSRVLDDLGEPTEKIKDKEKYHRLDALRYAIAYADQPAATVEQNWLFG